MRLDAVPADVRLVAGMTGTVLVGADVAPNPGHGWLSRVTAP